MHKSSKYYEIETTIFNKTIASILSLAILNFTFIHTNHSIETLKSFFAHFAFAAQFTSAIEWMVAK